MPFLPDEDARLSTRECRHYPSATADSLNQTVLADLLS
jgi:hypothetical protein